MGREHAVLLRDFLRVFTVALAMMNTDSWLASDTSGSVFMSALMRASGSLDSRLWVTTAAGPVCCWLLSSSASAPRLSSSLPHRSGSCSVGVTGVATVAAILRFFTQSLYLKHKSQPSSSYMSQMTTTQQQRASMCFRPFGEGPALIRQPGTLTPRLFLSRQLSFVADWTDCEPRSSYWLELNVNQSKLSCAKMKLRRCW